jgi:hypothetical protein
VLVRRHFGGLGLVAVRLRLYAHVGGAKRADNGVRGCGSEAQCMPERAFQSHS